MKKVASILPLVGIFWSFLEATEYAYPVGIFRDYEGQKKVLTFYQKSPEHTELWQGSPEIDDTNRAILSTFTPVGVAMLPNDAGFSFFDNGRLRVKQFLKRSPKAIDIYEPVYDIGSLVWLTPETCIFHAKERTTFSLYQLTSDGSVSCLVKKGTCDCFYPSVIGSSLYYIEMRDEGEYALMRTQFPLQMQKEALPECLCSKNTPLAFLTMTGEREGFVVEHPANVDLHKDLLFTCTLHHLIYNDSAKQYELPVLFTFVLPLTLLNPANRDHLSESLYPLLPRFIQGTLYFVTMADDNCMQICAYTEGKVRVLKKGTPGQILFTPIDYTDDYLVYGSSLPLTWPQEDQDPTSGISLLPIN